MFVYRIGNKEKILHDEKCLHARRIAPERRGYFNAVPEALEKGFRWCSLCSPVGRQLRKERKELLALAQKYSLQWSYQKGILIIKDFVTSWVVIQQGGIKNFAVYHGNYKFTHREAQIPGYPRLHWYHRQKNFSCATLVSVFTAIGNHLPFYAKYGITAGGRENVPDFIKAERKPEKKKPQYVVYNAKNRGKMARKKKNEKRKAAARHTVELLNQLFGTKK